MNLGRFKSIDWLNHFIELLVVIIGITIAFMLNRSYESHKANKLEQQYLSSFLRDIAADEAALDTLIQFNDEKISKMNHLLDLIGQTPVNQDSAVSLFALSLNYLPFDANIVTYESLTASGNIGLISDYTLKYEIIKYYHHLSTNKYINQLNNSYLNNYIIPFALSNLDFQRARFLNYKTVKSKEFYNLVRGYIGLLQQNKSFYTDVRKSCVRLQNMFKKVMDE